MAIVAADIHLRFSGGSTNTDGDLSLGGEKSSTQLTHDALHDLFDQVSSQEGTDGDIEYRCIYIHNAHATLTMQNSAIWLAGLPSVDASVALALGSSTVGGIEQTVADESTAPTGVTFVDQASLDTSDEALVIGDLLPGESKAIWVRRTINAGTPAINGDGVTFQVDCDTAA